MRGKIAAVILALAAAGLLLASLRLPLWQMHLVAPQYQDEDALDVMVYPNEMRGDLAELKVLNSYIGVHVPETLPQNRWLPAVLIGGGVAGLVCAFLPGKARRRALFIVPSLVALALAFAAVQAQLQMREIGTNRDDKTKMVGVKDFTPPLLGRTKVAQFTITSYLSWGSLAIGAALGALWLAAWLSRPPRALRPADTELPPGAAGGLTPEPRST